MSPKLQRINTPDFTKITFEENILWNLTLAGEWSVEDLLNVYPFWACRMRGKFKIRHETRDNGSAEQGTLIINIHFYKPKTLKEKVKGLKIGFLGVKYAAEDLWHRTPIWIQVILKLIGWPIRLVAEFCWMILAGIMTVFLYPLVKLLDFHGKTLIKNQSWNDKKRIRKNIADAKEIKDTR